MRNKENPFKMKQSTHASSEEKEQSNEFKLSEKEQMASMMSMTFGKEETS